MPRVLPASYTEHQREPVGAEALYSHHFVGVHLCLLHHPNYGCPGRLMQLLYVLESDIPCLPHIFVSSLPFPKSLVSPKNINETLPALEEWLNQSQWLSAEIMSGLVTALLYTAFFALCPVMFKAIANSGSHATSVQEAEKYALKYYWYFMLVTAFVFTGLADAAMKIWESRLVSRRPRCSHRAKSSQHIQSSPSINIS